MTILWGVRHEPLLVRLGGVRVGLPGHRVPDHLEEAPDPRGVVLALYLRARSPERYRTIGHIIYEDTTERPDSGSGADVHGNHAIKSTEPSTGA